MGVLVGWVYESFVYVFLQWVVGFFDFVFSDLLYDFDDVVMIVDFVVFVLLLVFDVVVVVEWVCWFVFFDFVVVGLEFFCEKSYGDMMLWWVELFVEIDGDVVQGFVVQLEIEFQFWQGFYLLVLIGCLLYSRFLVFCVWMILMVWNLGGSVFFGNVVSRV